MTARLPLLLLILGLIGPTATPTAGWAGEPFEQESWKVTGRPLEAHAVEADDETWLAVISVEGAPPAERRYVTLGRLGGATPARVELPRTVVTIDLGDLDPAPGPEILAIESGRLRVLATDGSVRFEVPVTPPLPLPPRTRQVSRLRVLGDWDGLGRSEALLPDMGGFRLLPLSVPESAHAIGTAISHAAGGFASLPTQGGAWLSQLAWPEATLADEDGDGTDELWVTDRFGLEVFRRGASGLQGNPALRQPFPPFSFEEELRHRANLLRAEPTDLDGDGLSDLIVVRTSGTLLGSRTHAALYRNRGQGPDPMAPPDAVLEVDGGFGQVQAVDLDGDGAAELVQSVVEFGLIQMIRIMTRGRADVRLRLHVVHAEGDGLVLEETWTETISVPFDTESSRVGTLLPRADGDWNGDGKRDLIYGNGRRLAIRLAERGPAGVRFGDVQAVEITPSEGGLAADLDGDGFDELVLWDPLDREGTVRILRNRRVLPGSPPRIEPRD